MLALRVGRENFVLGEVPPYLLRQASERKGHWKITVYDAPNRPRTVAGRCKKLFYGAGAFPYSIVLTEEEYSKLSRTIYHNLRNETKINHFFANMENAAQALWPTGSLDHVAMRHLGVVFVLRYITNDMGSGCCLPLLHMIPCMRRLKQPELERIAATARPAVAIVVPGQPGSSGDAPPAAPPGGGGEAPPPAEPGGDGDTTNDGAPTPVEPPPPVLDAPATPADPENGAEASEDMRTLVRKDVVAVLGQNYDKSEPVNHIPIVGLMIGPCQVKPNVYSKSASNLKAAIQKRITEKAIKPNLTKEEKTRIGNLIRKSMSNNRACGVFSKENIQDWAVKSFNLEECKSGKWGIERFRNSLDNLYAKEHPTYSFKADIKYECMPEGKAPRMLIADGDEGQLMGLAVVKCFEDLLFHHFESRSIKHVAKREAIDRVLGELIKPGAKAVEGDGTAWDTTCNVTIRAIVENPILRHIFEELSGFGVVPSTWMEEHSLACEQKKLRLFFKNKFESMSKDIDAIRRSGHRGTSCLNWWVNFVMWVSSVFKAPERFLDVKVRHGTDLVGINRWWNGCFEGDDSLCTMCPPMVEGDKLSEVFLKFWKSAGFNMKIVFCDTRATFVGYHIACNEGQLTKVRSPELPRALANSGVSVSPAAIQAARERDSTAQRMLGAAAALARASDFAGILPSVSEKYLRFSESISNTNFDDREMSIRAYGEDGHGAREVRELIQQRNLGVTVQDEQDVLNALGYTATHDEVQTFQEYIWSMDPHVLTDYDSFRESLPPSWRTS